MSYYIIFLCSLQWYYPLKKQLNFTDLSGNESRSIWILGMVRNPDCSRVLSRYIWRVLHNSFANFYSVVAADIFRELTKLFSNCVVRLEGVVQGRFSLSWRRSHFLCPSPVVARFKLRVWCSLIEGVLFMIKFELFRSQCPGFSSASFQPARGVMTLLCQVQLCLYPYHQ